MDMSPRAVWSGRYTLTARVLQRRHRHGHRIAENLRADRISNDARPSNVTWWIVPGATAAPGPATATVTWPTRSGEVPNWFVSSSRIRLPPTLLQMMSRTVWLSKPRRRACRAC